MWTNKYWHPRLLILNTVLLKFFMPIVGRGLMTKRILIICTVRLYLDRKSVLLCFNSGMDRHLKSMFLSLCSWIDYSNPWLQILLFWYYNSLKSSAVHFVIRSFEQVLLSYCLRMVTACDLEFLFSICNQAVTPTQCNWPLCCRYQQMHQELQIGNVRHRTQSHIGCQSLHMQWVQDEA